MARDVYKQSVGNPIQLNRLPRQPGYLVSTCGPRADANDQKTARECVLWLAMLSAFLLLSALAHHIMNVRWAASPLVWFAVWLLQFEIRSIITRLSTPQPAPRPSRELILLFGGFYALDLLSFPAVLYGILTAVLLAVLIWKFSRHWIELCLAAPIARETRHRLRQNWHGYVAAMLLILGIVVAVAIKAPVKFGWIALVAGLVHGWPLLNGKSRREFRVATEAVISWLAYNRRNRRIPGMFYSPAGGFNARFMLTGACICMLTITLMRWPDEWSIVPAKDTVPYFTGAYVALDLLIPGEGCTWSIPSVFAWAFGYGVILAFPTLFVLSLPPFLTHRLLVEASEYRVDRIRAPQWKPLIEQIRKSTDPIERNSIYMGRIAYDGSPLLIPREVFHEHAHFLGDSGSGKTSMGLAPWLEQMIGGGDCSVVIIDLKADSHELLATATAAANERSQLTGQPVPVRHFSNQAGLSTFACNPLTQSWFQTMEDYVRTDILCEALGLSYGSGYGEGYYSSANATVLYHTIRKYPETATFLELTKRLGEVAASADKRELHPEIRKSGVHVQTVADRLGSFESLNVSSKTHPQEVCDAAIDFRDVFTKPQVLYFHLSATLAPGSSPEIARLAAYSLLAAASQSERKHHVFLVVDEFQRMAAPNLDSMLQLARSMGVGIIIANQSMEDLKTGKNSLIPAIEANCRYRQWFSVSASEDRERIVNSSGETIDIHENRSESVNSRATTRTTQWSQFIDKRVTVNDILLTSDNPFLNIVKLSRGAGYAQYGGMAVIAESDYHITAEEFERRKKFPWPNAVGGAFVPPPRTDEPFVAPKKTGPVASTEVIGDADTDSSTGSLLDSWMQEKQKAASDPASP